MRGSACHVHPNNRIHELWNHSSLHGSDWRQVLGHADPSPWFLCFTSHDSLRLLVSILCACRVADRRKQYPISKINLEKATVSFHFVRLTALDHPLLVPSRGCFDLHIGATHLRDDKLCDLDYLNRDMRMLPQKRDPRNRKKPWTPKNGSVPEHVYLPGHYDTARLFFCIWSRKVRVLCGYSGGTCYHK